MASKTIAVIEDEDDIREIVAYNLKRDGFDVLQVATGEDGLKVVIEKKPALVLLDLMLPGIDGLEVCQRIKNHNEISEIPVILLTAKGEESDVVLGLGMGADDYITKPFSPRELVARIRAVLRRADNGSKAQQSGAITVGELVIDSSKYKVTLAGEPLALTATEFKVLYFLASRPGRVFTREQIINNVLGENVVIVDRNMDVHIRAIRKKLGDYKDIIETVRGIGYRFKE